jgi:hypothetical protein
MAWLADSAVELMPSQEETGLDPTIHNQMTGNQRALEVRKEPSRSRWKRPAIPTIPMVAAANKPMYGSISFGCVARPYLSLGVQEKPVEKFQGQQSVNLGCVIAIAL